MRDAEVVFKNGDVGVVFHNPFKETPGCDRFGTPLSMASKDDEEAEEEPKFALTNEGFRCYAKTRVEPNGEDLDTPVFRGKLVTERGPARPRYRVVVRLSPRT